MLNHQPSAVAIIPMQAAIFDLDHAIIQLQDNLQNLASRLDGALTPIEVFIKSAPVQEDHAVARSPIVRSIEERTERLRTLDNVVGDLLRRLEI